RDCVKPGMTVNQAVCLCHSLRLCEPDPVYYDEQFARLLAALSEVSPVVEPAELGGAYVGTDGLGGLYGEPEGIVEEMQLRIVDCGLRIGNTGVESTIRNPQSAIRVGWGLGKFVAWVAASRAQPGGAVIVRPGDEAQFLSAQPLAVLPLDSDTHRRLRQLALKHPRRIGWRVQVVRVRAELEHGASWLVEAILKDPSADRDRIAAPLRTRLEQAPPTGAVERLAVEFTAFAPGAADLQLFARDASAAARADRRRALRTAAREIKLRLKRSLLYHVIEVQPWSRLPERRYALIDYEP